MSIWDSFSDEELYTILECGKFKEVRKKIKREFDEAEWLRAARNSYAFEQQSISILNSFLYAIRNSAQYSALVLLGVIGSITVAFVPLTIMTAVLSVVALTTGIYFFATSYQKSRHKIETTNATLDFNAIKIMCADEIIDRKKIQLASSMRNAGHAIVPMSNHPAPVFEYELKHKSRKIKKGAVFGLVTGALLFGTYFAGAAILLHAFSLIAVSGMMLGPIGMAVSLAAAIGIGIICGYMYYHRTVIKEDKVKQFMKFQKEQIEDKRAECHELKKKTKNYSQQSKLVHAVSEPALLSHVVQRSQDDGLSYQGYRPC